MRGTAPGITVTPQRVRPVTVFLLAWLVAAVLLTLLGLSVKDSALLALGVTIQAATGAYWWQQARRNTAPMQLLEAIGMGLVLGPVLALLSGVVLGQFAHWPWWWLLPTLAAVVDARVRRTHRRVELARASIGELVPAAVGLLAGLGFLMVNLRRYPLHWTGTWDGYHGDMSFFEALGASIARFGPFDSIFMIGEPIRYHWFVYAWQGQLAWAFDAEPFAALTRLLPFVAVVALVALTVWWTRALIAKPVAVWVAVALVVVGGYVGAVNGTLLNVDSPSQALTTPWLLAFTIVVASLLTGEQPLWRSCGALSVVALLAVVLTGGKVSAAAVALGALGVAAVIGSVQRAQWATRAWVVLGIATLAVAITYLVVLAGAASPGDLQVLSWEARASTIQGLNSSPSNRGVVLGTVALAFAMIARWAGMPLLLLDPSWRRRPEFALGLGAGLVGLVALAVFSQGLNETWFALGASAPISVLSAVGLAVAWERLGLGWRPALTAFVGALVALPVVAFAWAELAWEAGLQRFWGPWLGWGIALATGGLAALVWRPRRVLVAGTVAAACLVAQAGLGRLMPFTAEALGGPQLTAGQTPEAGQAPGPSEVAPAAVGEAGTAVEGAVTGTAAESTDETVLTAPTVVPEPRTRTGWSSAEADAAGWLRANGDVRDVIVTNEVLAYLVPALTGMRTYISGAPYQASYGAHGSVDGISGRIGTSMQFTTAPDDATFAAMCQATVSWAWVAKALVPVPNPGRYGEIAYENDDVAIMKLDRDACD